MTTTTQLKMRFRDSNGRVVGFTINPPALPVDMDDVDALMDLIIATDTFYTYTGGSIIEKLDVRLFVEEVESLVDYEE
jgi:hypothetical protein